LTPDFSCAIIFFARNSWRQGIASVHPSQNIFRLNVGFFLGQSVGYSREFLFESPEVRLDPELLLTGLSGTARITRTAQGLLVQVQLRAATPTECVRCLTDISQPLTTDFTELYAFTRGSMTDSGLLLPESGYIDLTSLAREYMLLAQPISPLCRPDCKGLCPICGENLNEVTCPHQSASPEADLSAAGTLPDQEE
jgi:uncharacterized protein